ncbi:hypothetical protein MAUB_58560 [Mycolicibacterium aubagnense]|uniref:Lipoprotein n=1 Tax=Mycolicibacterium aubagnense TaxID=319707 RepID=A0ABN5Z1W1_9MYCO|nr:hypothetical protein MAUB_58560 [Mycolicibacterium aubagnense]
MREGSALVSAACGWNGCAEPGDDHYNGRCEDHENSQCRTEGCAEDADDGEGYDGFCGNCADREDARGRWD